MSREPDACLPSLLLFLGNCLPVLAAAFYPGLTYNSVRSLNMCIVVIVVQVIEEVLMLVLATKHHELLSDDAAWPTQKLAGGDASPVASGADWPSQQRLLSGRKAWEWLLDADLGVLAAPPAAYLHYAAAVRSEYCHVPDEEFRWVVSMGRPGGGSVWGHIHEGLAPWVVTVAPRTGKGRRAD